MEQINTTSRASATDSLRILLKEIVDYAGIFPPAALPLHEAVERFVAHRRSEESWMLARFIIPAARAPELGAYDDLFSSRRSTRFSILPGGGDTGDDFLDMLESDIANVQLLLDSHSRRVSIDQFEMKLPREFVGTDVIVVRQFLDAVSDRIGSAGLQESDLFFEIPLDENLRQTLPVATGAMAAFNRDRTSASLGCAGLKMRTGGTEAGAFPNAEDVALVISSCRLAGVPFKATAGLHHPIHHFNDTYESHVHGFLNLFCASVLASAHDLAEDEITEILCDEDASHFRFDTEGLAWRQLPASNEQIKSARSNRALSFGSCSFDEPVEDLRDLGLF